jgi:hypothetical protein
MRCPLARVAWICLLVWGRDNGQLAHAAAIVQHNSFGAAPGCRAARHCSCARRTPPRAPRLAGWRVEPGGTFQPRGASGM